MSNETRRKRKESKIKRSTDRQIHFKHLYYKQWETNKEAKHDPEEWIKKMWYIYMMEYYLAIKRNEIGSFVETWMDLETVIHSEVRKRKKYNALMHTCGI